MVGCAHTATYSSARAGVRKDVDVEECPIPSADPIEDLAARVELETSTSLSPMRADLAELS